MTLAQLTDAGFKLSGQWQRNKAGVATCHGSVPAKTGVYLFVVGENVRYVGAALGTLQRRMKSYERRQKDGKSNRPVHAKLAEAIDISPGVMVYTREIASTETTEWHTLPVSVILGLEAALIIALNPTWNRRGNKLLLDGRAVNGPDDPGS